jgi:exosortase
MLARSPAVSLNGSPSDGCEGSPLPRGATLPIGSVAVVIAALAILFGSIVRDMAIQWWDDPNYSHGYLVPLFSGYVLWRRRRAVLAAVGEGNWLGLPVLLVGLAMLVVGVIGAENFLMRSSLIVILAGLVLFHWGRRTLSRVAFPLGFLFFMVPLPQIVFNVIAFPLQGFAAQNATSVLEALGIPVLRDGNVIHLSRITLGVTEACSGIRSLISLLALAVAWSYVVLPSGWTRLALVASAVPITIGANAARIVLTGLIGQYVDPRYAEGFFHSFSGWLVFLVAVGLLMLVQAALTRVASRGRPAGEVA